MKRGKRYERKVLDAVKAAAKRGCEWKEKNRKTGKKRKREGDVERADERGGGGGERRMASM